MHSGSIFETLTFWQFSSYVYIYFRLVRGLHWELSGSAFQTLLGSLEWSRDAFVCKCVDLGGLELPSLWFCKVWEVSSTKSIGFVRL